MSTLPVGRPAQSTLLLPPIRGLPAPPGATAPDALGAYVATTRSWDRQPVALVTPVTCALWIELLGVGLFGGWLVAVRAGATGKGPVFGLLTLGHPGLLLVLSGVCVVVLAGLVPFTRGLTHAGGPQLGLVVVAGAAGAISLLGVVVVVVLTVAVTVVAVVAFVAAVERS
jgi:hypothetical protein